MTAQNTNHKQVQLLHHNFQRNGTLVKVLCWWVFSFSSDAILIRFCLVEMSFCCRDGQKWAHFKCVFEIVSTCCPDINSKIINNKSVTSIVLQSVLIELSSSVLITMIRCEFKLKNRICSVESSGFFFFYSIPSIYIVLAKIIHLCTLTPSVNQFPYRMDTNFEWLN